MSADATLAVGFDFDHTLGLDNKLERTIFLRLSEDWARAAQIAFDAHEAAAAVDGALAAYRGGGLDLDAAIEGAFARVLGPEHLRPDAAAAFRRTTVEAAPGFVRPLPGVRELLAALRAHGIATAILTNGWSPLQQRKAALIGFDGPVIVSDDIGVRKPEPPAFDALARTLDVPRERIWFVGDDVRGDVGGALAAGMVAVWFDWEGTAYPSDVLPPTHVIHRLRDLLALLPGASSATAKRRA